MMNNEEFGNILSFGHGEPVSASWVSVDKGVKIIKFVFDDPIVGGVASPELGVSLFFLMEPYLWISFDSSGGHGLAIRFDFF